jgi:hypothetical protein
VESLIEYDRITILGGADWQLLIKKLEFPIKYPIKDVINMESTPDLGIYGVKTMV